MQHGTHRCSGTASPSRLAITWLAGSVNLAMAGVSWGLWRFQWNILRSEIIYLKMDQGNCVREQLPGSHQAGKGSITWRG